MKTAVFLFGVAHRSMHRTGQPLSPEDFALLDRVARKADVSAVPVWAIPDPAYAGRPNDVNMTVLRKHRESVLEDIQGHDPDVVMACGPIALKCLMDKGNAAVRDNLRMNIDVPALKGITVVATQSLEQVAAKPGMEKWLILDLLAGIGGRTETAFGKYKVLMPGTPEWAKLPPALASAKVVGLDLETYPGLNEYDKAARIRMAVISHRVGHAWIVQARRDSKLPAWLRTIVESSDIVKAGSNIKFDYRWLRRFGWNMRNMFDTSTAEHVLDCTNPLTDLKSLTFIYVPKLGDYSRGHRNLVKERGGWEFVRDDEQYDYCGADGEASIGACRQQMKKLKQEKLTRPFNLSMAVYHVLARMESDGACVAMSTNDELDLAFSHGLVNLRKKITKALGPINPKSPHQLAEALRSHVSGINLSKAKLARQFSDSFYKLPGDSPEDDWSTDKEVLEREASKHPVIEQLLLFRKYAKLHGTYINALRAKHVVTHADGLAYVHTSYRTDVTETYRLSSQAPNLQNIPRKPEPGELHPLPPELNIKRQFVSRFEGGHIIEADLSQAEIRVAAHLSQDPLMIDAIVSGGDLHTSLTALFLNKSESEVTELERTNGKRQTFLVLYGGGARTLSIQLGIPKARAKMLLAQYFDTFCKLAEFIDKIKLDVKRMLVSESMFGYKRRFRAPTRWDQPEGWYIERAAWNHQVQNGAAAIVFVAMCDVEREFSQKGLRSLPIMQVHDSILVDTYPGEEQIVAKILRDCLQHPSLNSWGVDFTVPLVADVEIGENWGDMKKLDA